MRLKETGMSSTHLLCTQLHSCRYRAPGVTQLWLCWGEGGSSIPMWWGWGQQGRGSGQGEGRSPLYPVLGLPITLPLTEAMEVSSCQQPPCGPHRAETLISAPTLSLHRCPSLGRSWRKERGSSARLPKPVSCAWGPIKLLAAGVEPRIH